MVATIANIRYTSRFITYLLAFYHRHAAGVADDCGYRDDDCCCRSDDGCPDGSRLADRSAAGGFLFLRLVKAAQVRFVEQIDRLGRFLDLAVLQQAERLFAFPVHLDDFLGACCGNGFEV